MIYQAILFLPLIGFLIAGLFGRVIGDRGAEIVTSLCMVAAAVLSWVVFVQWGLYGAATDTVLKVPLLAWINSGELNVNWSIRIDTLTAVMLVVVNTVSALVHIYSIGYMHEDEGRARFFAYLSLFTFAMLALVTADNLVQMFFGWEGVGLASYLLIGFWYHKESAVAAAMKAFVVNRVGDFGFALGIFGVFAVFNTVDYDTIFQAAPAMADKPMNFIGFQLDTLTVLCLLLFMGAMGKSAQFLLHTWLPDAMEGPTPVSALIHAATMVTAGVFMVARLSPIFEHAPVALTVVTAVGAFTAFFAATVGLVQNDIKRVIAYSTCSQLGYMFAALGVGAYGAGVFHLFTHAFFKALLFLGAGSVIHAMHHEQDMRKMGGLSSKIPWTWALMLVGTLALTGLGIPGLGGMAGFYSKDAIVEATYAHGTIVSDYAFWLLVIAAFMTSFYSWRLMFMTFHGPTRADHDTYEHAHESPWVMLAPLVILGIGAIAAGAAFSGVFIGDQQKPFWRGAIAIHGAPHAAALATAGHEVAATPAATAAATEAGHGDTAVAGAHATATAGEGGAHHGPAWVAWSPTIAMAAGFALSWLFYIGQPWLPAATASAFRPIYLFLLNKWYIDELYDLIFAQPIRWLGRQLWKQGDGAVIDGIGPDGIAATIGDLTRGAVRLQSGFIYQYAFVMLIGVTLFATLFAVPAEFRQQLQDAVMRFLGRSA
jgi:NADH-quinone oxidoreductase subunit L